jgi:hypothetical protein
MPKQPAKKVSFFLPFVQAPHRSTRDITHHVCAHRT